MMPRDASTMGQRFEVRRDDCGFRSTILRRVAGDGKFRKGDEVRAGSAGAIDFSDDLRCIAREVTDCRVDLRKRDADDAHRLLINGGSIRDFNGVDNPYDRRINGPVFEPSARRALMARPTRNARGSLRRLWRWRPSS